MYAKNPSFSKTLPSLKSIQHRIDGGHKLPDENRLGTTALGLTCLISHLPPLKQKIKAFNNILDLNNNMLNNNVAWEQNKHHYSELHCSRVDKVDDLPVQIKIAFKRLDSNFIIIFVEFLIPKCN